MTDEPQGGAGPRTGPLAPSTPSGPGWYPDPWSTGQHRYWDGSTWTGGAFPHGPADPWSREGTDRAETQPVFPPPPVPPPSPGPGRYDANPPPPPEWAAPATYQSWSPPPPPDPWTPASPPITPSRRGGITGVGFVALVVAIMLVVGALGTLGGYLAFRHKATSPSEASGRPPAVIPTPTVPSPGSTVPADPAASALDSLVLTQADVPSTVVVQPNLDSGQFSADAPTLDLCNGNFASESRRTARVQVTAYDGTATSLLSTEAVLYTNPAATEQAFAELKSVAAGCPPGPVTSPVGEPTVATHFNAAPDGSWAATPTVTRLAYDFTFTDELGATQHSVAVYLRRGRVLMGVYFPQPDPLSITVAGQGTMEQIAAVFAGRMAALSSSVVSG